MHYFAALAYFPKITYRRFERLHQAFPTVEAIWNANWHKLVAAGFEEEIAFEFMQWRELCDIQKIEQELADDGVTTISLGEAKYPLLLSELPDPPITLFVRGTLPTIDTSLAVVGTRRATNYGNEVTRMITTDMARQKIVIVSGLALGIDGVAHEAALDAHGITVAVLGSGVDEHTIYPASHRRLAERIIASGGALVSEYPPGFKPTQYSFPARNRIIAGLSRGTLVTEAPTTSGALITAKHALDYNRDVFAVPHPITSPTGQGGNSLIRMGAILVQEAANILETMHITWLPEQPMETPILNEIESKVITILSRIGIHIDQIAILANLPPTVVMGTLTLLEMRGLVKNAGGMQYIRL